MEALFELIGVLIELFFSKDERQRSTPVRLATPAPGQGAASLPTTGRSYGRKEHLAARRRSGRQGGIGPRRRR